MKDKYYEYRKDISEKDGQALVDILTTMLTPIELAIFLDRSGLLNEGVTLQVAGEKHGFSSRGRAYQIENKTLRKLRHASRKLLLAPYKTPEE